MLFIRTFYKRVLLHFVWTDLHVFLAYYIIVYNTDYKNPD